VSLHDPDCAFTPSLADRDAWDDLVIYRADDTYGEWTREDAYGERVSVPTPWRPSIHMPKWAARTWLRVTSVRVERVQDISGDDARAEGVRYPVSAEGCPEGKCSPLLAIDVMERAIQWGILGTLKVPAARLPTHDDLSRLYFAQLWDSVYGNWDANPWVWVYAFEKVTP
jgi:hypothetical protein